MYRVSSSCWSADKGGALYPSSFFVRFGCFVRLPFDFFFTARFFVVRGVATVVRRSLFGIVNRDRQEKIQAMKKMSSGVI